PKPLETIREISYFIRLEVHHSTNKDTNTEYAYDNADFRVKGKLKILNLTSQLGFSEFVALISKSY
ncbi:MAG: hypothetical protein ACKO96_49650, partial [Flammeovirgaceae bacterium]